MGNFDKETNEAIGKMIRERQDTWDRIVAERQDIKNKIGQLTAELSFWESLHKDKDGKYNTKKHELNSLKQDFDLHVEAHREIADKLNVEIDVLENLKINI